MTTVQQLYPWSYATKGSEAVIINGDLLREALDTMREPHFYTGYSGLLSELGSASISMRVQGTEMNDVTSRLMIADLAKSMLFQLTAFGFAVVSITKRRIDGDDGKQSEFVVTQIRNAEEFTIGFQTHDSRRIYFAKENTTDGNIGTPGALKQLARGIAKQLEKSSDEQDAVGRDPNAVFLLAVSRPPSSDGRLMSSASVISPVRKNLEERMRTYQAQGFNHAYPLVYLTQQPVAMPAPVKESIGLDQTIQTSIFDARAREEIRYEEERITQELHSENAMTIVRPKKSTDAGDVSQVARPLGIINSSFQLAQGPNPIAPVFPADQTESYVDQVSACLAVPRSYVASNVSKVQTAEEQSIRETKLNAHFLAVSTGLEKSLSHARTMTNTGQEEAEGRPEEVGDEPEVDEESENGEKTKKRKKIEVISENSTRGLLVEVKITLAIPLDRITFLLGMGFLKRDKGLEMIAKMFGFSLSDLVSEKELKDKEIEEMALAQKYGTKPSKDSSKPGGKEPGKESDTGDKKRKLDK